MFLLVGLDFPAVDWVPNLQARGQSRCRCRHIRVEADPSMLVQLLASRLSLFG